MMNQQLRTVVFFSFSSTKSKNPCGLLCPFIVTTDTFKASYSVFFDKKKLGCCKSLKHIFVYQIVQ